jgi:Tfp pilus assembly protein PilX
MTRLRDSERGWALVTAVIVMSLMMGVGLATYSYVDTEVEQSANERTRESSFNYAEGVLNAQAFVLSRAWPVMATQAYTPDCASGGTSTKCPDQTTLNQSFNGADFTTGSSWTTSVRDNGGSEQCQNNTATVNCSYFYDDAATAAQPRWDANGDGEMWVRAQTTVRGKRRIVVARVSIAKRAVPFPENVLTAGSLTMRGGKNVINTGGAPVQLRCTNPNSGSCLNLKRGRTAILPDTLQFGLQPQHTVSPSGLDALRRRAQGEGGWYASCPGSTPTAAIVFVESGNCNAGDLGPGTATAPGLYIQANGTFDMGTHSPWYGIVYLYNQSNSCANDVFGSNGNWDIIGSVIVDGCGGFSLGTSSNTSLTYDARVFQNVYAYDFIGVVKNSFRELDP